MADEQECAAGRPVPVVINGSAGRGDVTGARAAFEPLRASGRVAIRQTDSAGVAPAVRTARAFGAEEIVVVGGDGSIQRTAREVAGNGVVLIPAPGGTLNHFARRYGIESIEAAAALVGRGRVEEVPLGVADDLLFLNTLVLGGYAGVVRIRDRLEAVMGKWPAAGVGFAAAIVRRPRVRLILETETRRLERTTAMAWIGLGRGSWPFSHEVDREIAGPVLEVVVLRDMGRAAAAAWATRLLRRGLGRGGAGDDPAVEIFHARSVLVRAGELGGRPPRDSGHAAIDATLDGDPVRIRSPLFVSAVDRALRIRVPS